MPETKKVAVIVVPTIEIGPRAFEVIPIEGHFVVQAVGMVPDFSEPQPRPYPIYREEMVRLVYGAWPKTMPTRVVTLLSLEEIAELVKNPQFIEVPA